jgi:PIN domain nuclease of toxin-antitoxin system
MPKTSELRPLLLDTHVWLWVVAGAPQLSAKARTLISGAVGPRRASHFGDLSVGDRISGLAPAHRLRQADGLVARRSFEPGPAIEPLTPRVAVESCELPDAFHADPADRMIVATVRVTDARLLTRDRRILDYAARGHLSALSA